MIERTSDPFYRTKRWVRISKNIRAKHPICELCNIQLSQAVDHIDDNNKNNHENNLWALCWACHNFKTKVKLYTREEVVNAYNKEMGED